MNNQEYTELFYQAIDFYNLTSYDKAEKICEDLITFNNSQADVFNLLSVIKEKKSDLESAIENVKRAIELSSNNYLYYVNLGEFYKRINNVDLAIKNLKKSIELNSNFFGSKYNLANIYKDQKNYDDAIILFEQAVELNPNDSNSLNNLGLVYMEKLNFDRARDRFTKALKIKPEDVSIEINLGLALRKSEDFTNAEFHFRSVIERSSNEKLALKELSIMYYNDSRYEEFIDLYKKYIKSSELDSEDLNMAKNIFLDFNFPNLYFNNFDIDKDLNNFVNNLDNYKPIEDIKTSYEFVEENTHVKNQLMYMGRATKDIKEKYASIFKGYFNHAPKNNQFGEDKIKIGFLVTDNNEGIFLKFMEDLIKSLPNNIFDIYLICDENGWKNKLKEKLNEIIKPIFLEGNIGLSVMKILDIKLDILYYWEIGTDSRNYFLAFFRLAPVQCTGWGWIDTTGIDTIDYFISSHLAETKNSYNNYTEKLIKLKSLPICGYVDPKRKDQVISLKDLDLSENDNIYFCCQIIRKIHPDFDILIAGILNKDPNGIIIFDKRGFKHISDLLKIRIRVKYPEISDRVLFLDLFNIDYLSLIKHSKVVLDTLYFGGVSTCYDSFFFNTPIVTLPWDYARGRYTLACYKQMGIEGLVANNFEEYIDLAVKTGTDKLFREKIVEQISQNKHKLFDNKDTIREHIEFFQTVARENITINNTTGLD